MVNYLGLAKSIYCILYSSGFVIFHSFTPRSSMNLMIMEKQYLSVLAVCVSLGLKSSPEIAESEKVRDCYSFCPFVEVFYPRSI